MSSEQVANLTVDVSSLERIVPDALDHDDETDRAIYRLHRDRYQFAAAHLRPGRLLDIACGVGYGARLLADNSPEPVEVLGVDISREAIDYARQRYGGCKVRFRVDDAASFRDDRGFDSIVSLETIEHMDDPSGFVRRLRDLLNPGGVLIASVPTTLSTDTNPHHRHDFTERSFADLFSALGLSRDSELRQSQSFRATSLLHRHHTRLRNLRPRLARYYIGHPKALLSRLVTTLRCGLTTRYITVVWRDGG